MSRRDPCRDHREEAPAPQWLHAAALPAHLTNPHALQPCWDLQLSGLGADGLRVALEIGLFSQLREFVASDELAGRLALDRANTRYLLELLWSMDLLERENTCSQRYRNLPVANLYLNSASAHYCGDSLLFRHRGLRQVGAQLDALVRDPQPTAAPADPLALRQGWAKAARSQIAQEQRAVTAQVACEIFSSLPEFRRAERFLDVGGGPGLVAIALARLRPALRGAIFEYDETACVAREHIARAGLSDRLQALAGDLRTDDFGDGYDLVWCSSVLHFVPDIPALLARLHRSMRPGGVIVCCHAELHPDAHEARRIVQYYLHLRMQARHVLPQGELAGELARSGFVDIGQLDNVRFPVAPVTALVARKEKE